MFLTATWRPRRSHHLFSVTLERIVLICSGKIALDRLGIQALPRFYLEHTPSERLAAGVIVQPVHIAWGLHYAIAVKRCLFFK